MQFTQEDILEIMKCKEDPVHFIEKYVIKQPLKLEQRVLVNTIDQGALVVELNRQTGKTTAALAIMLWKFLFECNTVNALISFNHVSSVEMSKRFAKMHADLPDFLRVPIDKITQSEIRSNTFVKMLFVSSANLNTLKARTLNNIWIDEPAVMAKGVNVVDLIGLLRLQSPRLGNLWCVGTGALAQLAERTQCAFFKMGVATSASCTL